VIRCPKLFRRICFGVVLGLAIFAVPAVSQALDIIAPIQLLRFFPRIPSVPLNENVIRIPMTISRPGGVQRLTLEATLYRPPGPGPFPLVVLSHGTSRTPRERLGERLRYDAQSWEFVSMGFAVVIPMRRGYGHSEGDYAEGEGLCDHSHFYAAGLESARDLLATVKYVSALPGIDPQRLVLAGHSSGGFASLILASQGLPGVRGVINFAGGRGSSERQNCSPDKLIEACGLAGRTTRVPTLWLYAQNDSYFPPSWPGRCPPPSARPEARSNSSCSRPSPRKAIISSRTCGDWPGGRRWSTGSSTITGSRGRCRGLR
jgi:dienelactone hydrolase